jgi:hypothetical protein
MFEDNFLGEKEKLIVIHTWCPDTRTDWPTDRWSNLNVFIATTANMPHISGSYSVRPFHLYFTTRRDEGNERE